MFDQLGFHLEAEALGDLPWDHILTLVDCGVEFVGLLLFEVLIGFDSSFGCCVY